MELEPADTKNYNPPGMDADAYECKDGARPKCAVFGICSGNRGPCDAAASQFAYFGLHAQQHRGQESAGILSMEVHDAVSAANKKRKREDRILPPVLPLSLHHNASPAPFNKTRPSLPLAH
eukprot:1392692-Amorphochlora_amoeboformis.AAC.1